MRRVGRGEHAGALRPPVLGQAAVHVVGREQAEAAVMMFSVVPGEEALAVSARVLDRAEPVRKRRPIFQSSMFSGRSQWPIFIGRGRNIAFRRGFCDTFPIEKHKHGSFATLAPSGDRFRMSTPLVR